ncbi:MAG TPA: recombinase family protein [Dehalococcoidia bacterium]|nr:recombinase family protein [Dehalococcoidia bacterium]
MKKAAIYARVSPDKQEEQRTIESQVAALREVCRRNEVEVVSEYTDDGYSGTTLVRPGLDRLRDDASKGLFQAVYILSPDRLARKYVYQVLILEELQKHEMEVRFLDHPVTGKPEDQLLLGIQGVIAEYERAQIMERTRRGKLHRARLGQFVTGRAPLGYDFVKKSSQTPARWRVNEREATVVRLIFSLYLQEGQSTTQIARELMKRKVSTMEGLGRWQANTVYRILKNESYVGRAYYNKCEGDARLRDRDEWVLIPVPAIIDEETFRMAQETLKTRRRRLSGPGRPPLRSYLFSGLLRCAYCGSRYGGFSAARGKYPYYRCMNFSRMRPLTRTCRARAIRAERIEGAVVQEVTELVTSPEVLRKHLMDLAHRVRARAGGNGQAQDIAGKQQGRLEQQRQKLLDLYLDGLVSREDYAARKNELEAKLAELDRDAEEVSGLPQVDDSLVARSVNEFAKQAGGKLATMSPEEMRVFLMHLLDEMTFDWQRREVRLVGHIPAKGGGQILSELSGNHTPVISRKNVLRFALDVPV